MTTSLQVFNYNGANIRTVSKNGEPWFVAADVCRVLEIGNPSDAIARLEEDERTLVSIEGASNGLPVNAINEPGLYSLILSSRKPEARAFKRWITHEVIPAIRRHGMYAIDEILANPDLAIAALTQLKEEREQRKALELTAAMQRQQILELQPKASYYDLILQSKSTVPITKIAKDYGMSAKALNKLLHEIGVQYKLGRTWILYQQFAEQGYTQSRTYAIDADRSTMHTYWTQKGRLFLYDLLKSVGILPLIEQGA
ncbi:MAG: phage antirepressor [Christensenellales bacterium]|jgi:anti-repressor protein